MAGRASRSPCHAQERILAVGGALLERALAQDDGLLSGRIYSDALMQWALKDPAVQGAAVSLCRCLPHPQHA